MVDMGDCGRDRFYLDCEDSVKEGEQNMTVRATLGDLKRGIECAIKNGVDENAVILWTDQTNDGDKYAEFELPNGTILIGLEEKKKDGTIQYGTLPIQPTKIGEWLS